MKTIVILFALLCAACVAGEIMIVLGNRDEDEEDKEDENNEER